MGGIGGGELVLILLVALLIFGPGKLADMGKGLGQGLKNFKKGLQPEDQPKTPAQPVNATEPANDSAPTPPATAPPEKPPEPATTAPAATAQPEKPPDPEGGPSAPAAS